MDKKEYKELLKRKEWKNKRNVIIKRDEYKCVKCSCKKTLQVHHTYYLKDKMPWEVPDECLITLCRVCHIKEHKENIVPIKDEPPIKKVPKNKPKSKYPNLSKKDEEIQLKYDLLKKEKKLPKSTYEQLVYVPLKKRKKNK